MDLNNETILTKYKPLSPWHTLDIIYYLVYQLLVLYSL